MRDMGEYGGQYGCYRDNIIAEMSRLLVSDKNALMLSLKDVKIEQNVLSVNLSMRTKTENAIPKNTELVIALLDLFCPWDWMYHCY